jgi:peptide/nickel transport system permease protein
MLVFIVRRLLQSMLVIFGVLVLTFLVARVVPSNPAAMWAGGRATPEEIERASKELGLDRPLYVQLGSYIADFVRGDLGRSLQTRRPVASELRTFFPATIELVLFTTVIAVVFGLPLGVLSAHKKDRLLDHASRTLTVGLVAMPTFWLALLLQVIFFRELGVLPLGGQLSDTVELFHPLQRVTGFVLLDALITGNPSAFWDGLKHIILPAVALAAYLGVVARMTRAAMVEILNEDYIIAGRSYGLSERVILWRYALKNSLGPTATVVALTMGYMLVNTFIVEALFSWPGIGTYIATAVVTLDYPAIIGVTVFSAIAYVLLNTIADMIVALDPRVRAE